MGAAAQAGFQTPALVGIGLGVGLLCGAFNGFLVARIGLPSIVVTIGTMSLFRGIAQIVLGDQAYGGYPASFAWFGQGYMSDFSWWPALPGFEVVTFEMVAFAMSRSSSASFCTGPPSDGGSMPSATTPSRRSSPAFRSGAPISRLFLMTGLMSGFAAVCLTSRLGSTRHTIAAGWELEVVTMAVLGGVSILGGSGTIPGVVLAAIVMGLVTFGLGLLNVPGIVMSIFIGLLLILVIALPILVRRIRSKASRMRAREKYAFKMQLNPGMEEEYRRRHDEIWPELVGPSEGGRRRGLLDPSRPRDRHSLRVFWRPGGSPHGRPARPSGDEAVVGPYGRHHGGEPRQLAGGEATRHRLPYGLIP